MDTHHRPDRPREEPTQQRSLRFGEGNTQHHTAALPLTPLPIPPTIMGRHMATQAVLYPVLDALHRLLHEVQWSRLSWDVPGPAAFIGLPLHIERCVEHVPGQPVLCQPGAIIPDRIDKDLSFARPPGHSLQPQHMLVVCVHDRGDVLPLGNFGAFEGAMARAAWA